MVNITNGQGPERVDIDEILHVFMGEIKDNPEIKHADELNPEFLNERRDSAQKAGRVAIDCFNLLVSAFNKKNRYIVSPIAVPKVRAINETADDLLFKAVSSDKTALTRLLIKKGANVNAKNNCRHTPLHIAAQRNNVKMADLLIEKGANINARDLFMSGGEDVRTPLHIAAERNHVEMADLLIERGASANAFSMHNIRPLDIAAERNHVEVADLLIERGADVNADNCYGTKTALLRAIEKNHFEMVTLLTRKGADINAQCMSRVPPLSRAIDAKMTALLIKLGADVNAKYMRELNPLHIAIDRDDIEMANVLIEGGANINARDEKRYTPLLRATYMNRFRMVTLLIRKGADLNAQGPNKQSALIYANTKEMVNFLIEKGANVNAEDPYGNTPLHSIGCVYTGIPLIENGANVHAENKRGATPLHNATNDRMAALLIEKGANVNAKDNFGNIPLNTVPYNIFRTKVHRLLQNFHIFNTTYPVFSNKISMFEANGMKFLENAYNQVHDVLTRDVAREVMSHITDVEAGCRNNAERIKYVTDPRSRSVKLYLDRCSKITKEDFDKIIEHHNLKSLHFRAPFEIEEFKLPADLEELELRITERDLGDIKTMSFEDIQLFKPKLAQELIKQKKIKNIVLEVVSDEIIDALLENPIEKICFNCDLTRRQLETIQQWHSVKVFIVNSRMIKNIDVEDGDAEHKE
ncbi:MAG: ankyrin repeat domain-containing protein [Waddliaceae bacterium]